MRDLERTVAALRAAFDASFAAPPALERPASEDLLLVRIDAQPYAIRVREVSEIVANKKVTALPASAPAALGVAAIRGAIVPVFDLGLLLGHRAVGRGWLALCGDVALAFGELDACVRVPRSDVFAATGKRIRHVEAMVRLDGVLVRGEPIEADVCGLIDIASVLGAIRRQR